MIIWVQNNTKISDEHNFENVGGHVIDFVGGVENESQN